jgi:hypothetical protein
VASLPAPARLVVRTERCARDRTDGSPMNAYERERAECAADEEARADRRLRAWRRRHTNTLSLRPVSSARSCGDRVGDHLDRLQKAG